MGRCFSLLIVLCLLLVSVFSTNAIQRVQAEETETEIQQTYYVSPSGSDDNPGTLEAPFKTIQKARDVVRTINSNMTGDIYVYLMEGTYYLEDTLTLNTEDSGTNGYNIIYKAYEEASPIISGGIDISDGWTLYDEAKNIYKREGVNWEFRQLYINNERGIRARTPNLEDEVTGGPYFYAKNGSYPYMLNTTDVKATDLNSGNAEMVFLASWSQYRGRIDRYFAIQGGRVTFKAPENNFAINHHTQGNAPYFIENAMGLLDAEGEWFLDINTDTLYYKPRSGEVMNTTRIIAPKLETVVNVEGTDENNRVHNIKFQGIKFMHSNWLAPSSFGYVTIQAGLRYQSVSGGNMYEIRNTARYTAPKSMFQLKYTKDIVLDHNTFQFSGSWGVMGYEGTQNTLISWNTFYKNAGGGIAMGVVDGRWDDMEDANYSAPDGQSIGDVIVDNTIDTVACDYKDMVGIAAMLPQHMTIAHNEVKNLPYTGISFGWNWMDHDHGMTNNQVYSNYVHHISKLLQDGAGIYTLGRMDGNTNFYYNYIAHIQQGPYATWNHIMGFYFDNGSAYKKAEFNVVDDVVHAFNAGNPPNHDNIIQYNYYNCDKGSISSSNTDANNIKVEGSNWPQKALDIIASAGPGRPDLPKPEQPYDLALGKTVTASSASQSPERAVDGDSTTRWAQAIGAPDPSWFKVDLGQEYTINSTRIKFELNSGYKYKIEYSLDDENWSTYSDKTAVFTSQQENYDVNTVNARYLRITVTDSSNCGGSIYDFNVYTNDDNLTPNSRLAQTTADFDKNPFRQRDIAVKMLLNGSNLSEIKNGDYTLKQDIDYDLLWNIINLKKSYLETLEDGTTDLTFVFDKGESDILKVNVIPDDGMSNVALNKTVTVSSESKSPCYAVDGDTTTRWAQAEGYPDPSWLKVDFGKNYLIDRVITHFELSTYKYKIEYSVDDKNWYMYQDHTQEFTTQQINEYKNENTVIARYMRITITNSNWCGGSLYEFSVFGKDFSAVEFEVLESQYADDTDTLNVKLKVINNTGNTITSLITALYDLDNNKLINVNVDKDAAIISGKSEINISIPCNTTADKVRFKTFIWDFNSLKPLNNYNVFETEVSLQNK